MADFWVFGYGSLMWNPGFPYQEMAPALLRGQHRALCVFSWVHRGTRENPGLVLGLDRGGACRGAAFRVAEADREPVMAYLRARELVTNVYLESERPIALSLPGRPVVPAVVYLADHQHEQYAGRLDRETVLAIVRDSVGVSGRNRDYVLATADHLQKAGVRDGLMLWLAERLREG